MPVTRSKEEARRFYDRLSPYYDFITGILERKYTMMALEKLAVKEGEAVLEIGFGTGRSLEGMARAVGENGQVHGIDISTGMLQVASRRLKKTGLIERVELSTGDAVKLPYSDREFDAAFISFALELFDTAEIPEVLEDVKRVLKKGGRLGVISLSRENKGSKVLNLYEWCHRKWPRYFDCRPIYVERSLVNAGFEIQSKQGVSMLGLPAEIVICVK